MEDLHGTQIPPVALGGHSALEHARALMTQGQARIGDAVTSQDGHVGGSRGIKSATYILVALQDTMMSLVTVRHL